MFEYCFEMYDSNQDFSIWSVKESPSIYFATEEKGMEEQRQIE